MIYTYLLLKKQFAKDGFLRLEKEKILAKISSGVIILSFNRKWSTDYFKVLEKNLYFYLKLTLLLVGGSLFL